MNLTWISLDKIKPNDYNPNVMSDGKFEALCDFLRTHSAEEVDPIWVRKDGFDTYEVIDGEHRWRAAKEVGWNKLKAFILDADADKARAFNVRKNRERGQLDAYKMGKILYEEYHKEKQTQNGIAEKFGLSRRQARDYIAIYENADEIRGKLNIGTMVPMPYRKSRDILIELKHPQPAETEEPKPELPVDLKEDEKPQGLKKFLSTYAEALDKIPEVDTNDSDIKLAIDFFKKLLTEKKVVCPICGEAHLQWRCGHDF